MAESVGEEILAFSFENPHLSGEYSPASGKPLEACLEDFESRFGTAPQVTA